MAVSQDLPIRSRTEIEHKKKKKLTENSLSAAGSQSIKVLKAQSYTYSLPFLGSFLHFLGASSIIFR
jgi:hypothetical protein